MTIMISNYLIKAKSSNNHKQYANEVGVITIKLTQDSKNIKEHKEI